MVNLNKGSLKRAVFDMKKSETLLTNLQPPFMALKMIFLMNCEEGRADVEELRQACPDLKARVYLYFIINIDSKKHFKMFLFWLTEGFFFLHWNIYDNQA